MNAGPAQTRQEFSPLQANESNGKRIVIATFGSLGDLHPYMAIALELQARGHRPVLATSAFYQAKIEAAGLEFTALRPDLTDFGDPETLLRQVMDLKGGIEFFLTKIIGPALRPSYEDLTRVVQNADLLIAQAAVPAAPLVAEKQGLSWISTALQPFAMTSAYDPPVFPPMSPIVPLLGKLRPLGPGFHRLLYRVMRPQIARWSAPMRALRQEIGLPPGKGDPLLEGMVAPALHLILFSRLLGAPQPDWPAQSVQTGFPFYDRQDVAQGMSPELRAFLDAGTAPLIFTLGSAAVMDAGAFYTHSAQAAQKLGRRALLLIGPDSRNRPVSPLPEGIAAFEYAPYSEVFPRALAIVHQGGVGTTGQAMRAGKPVLVMPYSHDQPDNAARMVRLGMGRTIARARYNAESATRELRLLLETPSYAARAAEIGEQVRQEHGTRAACDAIEAQLQRVP